MNNEFNYGKGIPKSELDTVFNLSEQLTNSNKSKTVVESVLEDKMKSISSGSDTSKTIPILLSSQAIAVSGDKLTKTNYLRAFDIDEDQYKHIALTEDEAKNLNKSITKMTSGGVTAAAPMICRGSKCPFAETCVTGDTLVSMRYGTAKKITDIIDKDKIYSFDTKTQEIRSDIVIGSVIPTGRQEVYTVVTEHGHSLKVTTNHLFYAFNGDVYSYISIDDGLEVGHKVLVTDLFYNEELETNIENVNQYGDLLESEIVSIEYSGIEDVYDITVNLNSNFFANGILVHNCELNKINKAPIGSQCIYEQTYLRQSIEGYLDEFNADPSRITEMHLISELSELDLYERRATLMLALQDQNMSQEDFYGFDANGRQIIKEDVSKFFNIKERIKKNRLKILETLMATRKDAAKVAVDTIQSGMTSEMASLSSKIEMILKNVGASSGNGYVDPAIQELLNAKKKEQEK